MKVGTDVRDHRQLVEEDHDIRQSIDHLRDTWMAGRV